MAILFQMMKVRDLRNHSTPRFWTERTSRWIQGQDLVTCQSSIIPDKDEDAHDDVLYPDNFDGFRFFEFPGLNFFVEYGQKLVTDSLHTLGTNIKKRLHGQLMETDLEDPDVFTFHDNSKQPFKTYINDDIVRVSYIACSSLPILLELITKITEGSYCKVNL